MHLLYLDESGSTGKKLKSSQQPVFTMVGVLVSDEKWRKTEQMALNLVSQEFEGVIPEGFELHAGDLLAPDGQGAFEGWERNRRNNLALNLLKVVADRHHVLLQVVNKKQMAQMTSPAKDYGFDWKDPWEISFALLLTMFEDHLRGPKTGATSSGLVIIDHEPRYLDVVRRHCKYRRAAKGWQEIKKVIEVGYSIESHANPLIQLTDLVVFTLRKQAEKRLGFGDEWPPEAREFFDQCRETIWPKVQYKTLKFTRLKVPNSLVDYVKTIAA